MPKVEWQGTVGPDEAGLRLDQFLAAPVGSRARAARLIAAGLVEVDGRSVQKRHPVAAGERVIVTAEPDPVRSEREFDTDEPAQATFAIAYEDDALVVV